MPKMKLPAEVVAGGVAVVTGLIPFVSNLIGSTASGFMMGMGAYAVVKGLAEMVGLK